MNTQTTAAVPEAKIFESNGLKLNYLDWGNPDAPPLILVHGMWDHARSWDWVAEALCQQWHVFALDLRGHGDSGWSTENAYLAAYFLADFTDFIDHLGYTKVTIVAHSFGGNCSTRFAALYPQRVQKLVLVDAMGPNAEVTRRWHEEGVVRRTRDWLEKREKLAAPRPPFASVEAAAERLMRTNGQLTQERALHLAKHGVRPVTGGFLWKQDPSVGNFLPEDFAIELAEYWRAITSPTLLCWGDKSWTTNPAEDGRAELFVDARCHWFQGAGHWLHHDQLDQFLTVLNDFL
ncbi:alpha/beta hydrolase [Halioxenophilus sp. WMMB6]|uniref:alpha/beta fold hydrolase n=1 Tax=Halioxenophilus sp. WMMB6 TaxID=3073815 RepID=UPI00295E9EB8|nr:alpha/beta hydrolase [Halioxenophilus sp. WMMB6]